MKAVRPEDKGWEENPQYAKKVLLNEAEIGTKGCVLQIVRSVPGSISKSHFHKKTREIFYILGGKGKVSINGKDIEVSEGSTVLCSPNERHFIASSSGSGLLFLVFKIDAAENDFFEVSE